MPRFALVLVFLLAGFAAPLYGQEAAEAADTYTVSGVAVDVKAANGTAARDKAFTEGGRKALIELAGRLTESKDLGFKGVDDNSIGRLIKSFEVENEKASGSRYIGKLTFHFRPEQTDLFLQSRGLTLKDMNVDTSAALEEQPAAPLPPRMVLLPVVRLGQQAALWEQKTAWARAWENYVSDTGLPNLVIPDGSAEDISSIKAGEALAGLPGPLMKVMQRYDAHGVIVAALTAPSLWPTPENTLSVQVAVFDAKGKMRNSSSFFLPAQPGRKPMEWLQDGAGYAVSMMQQAQVVPANMHGSSPYAPARPAALPPGSLQLTLAIPYSSPQQWQSMRTAIEEMPGVVRFDISTLTHTQATVQVAYQGSRGAFGTALTQRGLSLLEAPGSLTIVPATNYGVSRTVYPPPAPPVETTDDSGETEEDLSPETRPSPPPKPQAPILPPPEKMPPAIP
ncbi:MAG: DUF2066 domain-containing protein [Proteobacteria bacterium]|nr:DUF2066 domain-containing protein [Pseudomonadota bacterium]